MTLNNSIIDVPGIQAGHATNADALTGCTVILCPPGTVGGVDQRGGAPGTRETDALRAMHLVSEVHAVVLSGGSAFGLDAASGVVRFLEERGVGFETGYAKVPIVPAAILYDLGIGRADVRPGAEMGYLACQNASADPLPQGCLGAGAGATVGKILGMPRAMKSGIGCASIELGEGLIVAALAAVNALGDVIDPQTGKIIAGARVHKDDERLSAEPGYFADTVEVMKLLAGRGDLGFAARQETVIGVVATNALLDKVGANKVAQMAHDGLARTIRPAHTMMDGDTIFTLATGQKPADLNIIGSFAAEVFAQAILNAVRSAWPAGELPALGTE
jgi:L-aminopeptidase/D-esterase-like protein